MGHADIQTTMIYVRHIPQEHGGRVLNDKPDESERETGKQRGGGSRY
jgi:hypothetical protein